MLTMLCNFGSLRWHGGRCSLRLAHFGGFALALRPLLPLRLFPLPVFLLLLLRLLLQGCWTRGWGDATAAARRRLAILRGQPPKAGERLISPAQTPPPKPLLWIAVETWIFLAQFLAQVDRGDAGPRVRALATGNSAWGLKTKT